MGNHQSHGAGAGHGHGHRGSSATSANASGGSSGGGSDGDKEDRSGKPRRSLTGSLSRVPSSASAVDGASSLPDPPDRLPQDKLAKILAKKSHDEEGVSGISERTFLRSLFPRYPELGSHLYRYLRDRSKNKTDHITTQNFKQQCEKYLNLLDDVAILETYVKMFCEKNSEDMMKPEDLRDLLLTCYNLSMDHYGEGPKSCFMVDETLKTVVDSCFHSKNSLSVGYVTRWLEEHCHRLILPMHRYCVHIISTSWRQMEAGTSNNTSAGLELATPVLDSPPASSPEATNHLLRVSLAWLIAGSLDPVYSKPHKPNSPNNSGVNIASAQFLSRLVCMLPSHWTMLYASKEHGLGTNRFLHHVLAYKGPTMILLLAGPQAGQDTASEKLLFCIASPTEWRETHLYIGGPESALLQLEPKYSILEKGSKMLYLNTHIRGYPKGLRAGSDTRKPIIAVSEGFETMQYRGLTYPLDAIEVWGCGDEASREVQLDIKKWQVKEAERQRQVKLSAADWIDHPDRYLLELAGRPQYNNKAS